MEELQEKSLHRDTSKVDAVQTRTPLDELDPELKLAIHCADEKKAVNLIALDLREIASFTEFFVIASGTNQRQVQAIADEINEQLKKQLGFTTREDKWTTAAWIATHCSFGFR